MTVSDYVDERKRLEESLRESREQLEEAVVELKEAARETLQTPAEIIARRPYLWIGGALVIGLLLGVRSGRAGGRIA